MDPGHKARKDPSDSAYLDFQAVSPALRIMQLGVEELKRTHTRRRSRRCWPWQSRQNWSYFTGCVHTFNVGFGCVYTFNVGFGCV